MKQGQYRMKEKHSGAGIPHDISDQLTFRRPIAVYGTLGAGGLLFLEWTMDQPFPAISQEITAGFTKPVAGTMPPAAVNPDHGLNSFHFPSHGLSNREMRHSL
jgi:hypothetical protein